MFEFGDKIGIVCCSNGQKCTYAEKITHLKNTLTKLGLQPVFSDYIYEKDDFFSGTAKERAKALMEFYKNDEIKGIFDISGGDLANGILPYLDYDIISDSSKIFWGYSDLTTVINAIYAKTGKASVLYQIRNLIYDHKERQISDFSNSTMKNGTDLFDINYKFVQQNKIKGVVVGGNIRCFLKLAGTEYMPELENKVLLLESLNGDVTRIETYLCQLQQIGAFDKVSGIILGTFTEMEKKKFPTVEMLIKKLVSKDMPIVVTKDIGHGTNSKAIVIGQEIYLEA
ncbi:MAG: S66 peptidase family protein [Acutalibacteraceae bacterium]|nr:S66 peptidase family protein [Acutalibacteraceae bacterium]